MGVSFSTMITIFCNNLFVTMYSWKVNEHSVAPIPTNCRSILTPSEVNIYLGISLPSILMLLAEWASVEILIVMAASISMGAVGAMSISYTYHNLVYQFPYGFQIAIVSVVGNCIGEGSEKYGKVTALAGLIYSAILTGIIAFCTHRYAYEIATMYT